MDGSDGLYSEIHSVLCAWPFFCYVRVAFSINIGSKFAFFEIAGKVHQEKGRVLFQVLKGVVGLELRKRSMKIHFQNAYVIKSSTFSQCRGIPFSVSPIFNVKIGEFLFLSYFHRSEDQIQSSLACWSHFQYSK